MNANMKRYGMEMGGAIVLYFLTLAIPALLAGRITQGSTLSYAVALIPVPGLLLLLWAGVRALRRKDELQQRVMGEAGVIAGFVTGLVCFAYGMLEVYAGLPKFPTIWVFPIFLFVFILLKPFIQRRYR